MAKFYSSAVPEYQADKEQFEFVQMKDEHCGCDIPG